MSNLITGTDKGKYEKFYTPEWILDDLIKELEENVDISTITEFQENSAGGGAIIDRLKKYNKPIVAYDLYPEREDIKQCNYLKEKIEYKKGRVAVINPPFTKGLKFINKCIKECDYIVCILSLNSLLNIDYSNLWVENQIKVYRKVKWDDKSVSFIILTICKKNENDKYDYDR